MEGDFEHLLHSTTSEKINNFVYEHNWINELIGNRKLNILEIGFGDGKVLQYLALKNPDSNFAGVEINIDKIIKFQTENKKLQIINIDSILGNGLMVCPRNYYDIIIMRNVLHHLPSAYGDEDKYTLLNFIRVMPEILKLGKPNHLLVVKEACSNNVIKYLPLKIRLRLRNVNWNWKLTSNEWELLFKPYYQEVMVNYLTPYKLRGLQELNYLWKSVFPDYYFICGRRQDVY